MTTATYSFSELSKQAIHIARQLAREYKHGNYGGPHLLKALMHRDLPLLKKLDENDADPYYIEEWAEIRLEQYPKKASFDEPTPDELSIAVFNEAEHLQHKLGYQSIEPECILAAIATPGVYFNYEQLKTFSFTSAQVLEWAATPLNAPISGNGNGTTAKATPSLGKASSENIKKYCTDRLQDYKKENSINIIGRENELRQIYEIISRRNKSNVLLVGEPGVGKSAMLDAFVAAVAAEQIPEHLKGIAIYQIDNGALIAGAAYKGEQEDRMRKILRELSSLEKPVLIIDEIHTLVDKQNINGGVTAILKAELAKDVITIIATTTTDEYRKTMEKEPTFSRRFEAVKINEPDAAIAEEMLRQQAETYQTHYNLSIEDEVFPDAIRLSKRFIKDRKLPDAALDLLDRTLAVSKIMNKTAATELESFAQKLQQLEADKEEQKLGLIYFEMKSGLSPVLLARHNEEQDFKKILDADAKYAYLQNLINSLKEIATQEKTSVNSTDLNAVVASITGIPIGKIQTKEQQRLITMEEHLRERVIGQDYALKTVSEAILESRSGLNKAGQPIASFFFLGPTGTGKTELAKSLAEFLFQDENSIIRFDMSEFKEEHSAALLYGAPPGYVGYEEGGMLVNKIRQQPYAIVLFDEIEKAHPSVFDIFLQILDEGKMHDRLGKEGDFSNAVILFTSNIGAEHIINSFNEGKIPASDEMMEIMSRYFRPEFLARVTEIIPFAPINKENVVNIFKIHLKPLVKQLEQKGITLKVSLEAAEHLAFLGFTPKYGVRPLKGVIRNELRKPLSRMLVKEQIKTGDLIDVLIKTEEEKNILDWKITNQQP